MEAELIMRVQQMQDRKSWLALRTMGIGGSDAGTIVGDNPWKSPYALWLEKTGQLVPEDISDKDPVYWGTTLEDVVAKEFTKRTGKRVQRRIELIADMLRTKSAADIDFRDIEITFTANIPADIKEQADIVKELYGLVSQKRLLSLLPFIADPAAEMDELKREEADRQDAYGSDVTNDERGVLGPPDDGAGGTVE